MPFWTTAAIIGSAAAGIGGAAIAAHGAGKAANAQEQASMYAADLNKQAADEALAEQKRQYDIGQQNLAPWLSTGKGALSTLSGLMQPGGDLTKQFQAPTNVTEQNDPGYQFRLAEGQKALERSAAARGNLLTGATSKAINDYVQNSASNEYSNVYNRAFNEFQTNQANLYNRYAGLAGTGQTAANTLASAGQAYGNNVSNILTGTASNIGNAVENAAAARASGYAGSANAWSGALGGVSNSLTQSILLRNLMGGGGSSSGTLPLNSYGMNPSTYLIPPGS